jgi:hypothetical protein
MWNRIAARCSCRTPFVPLAISLFLLSSGPLRGAAEPEAPPSEGRDDLRELDPTSADYETPRAGEGFRTSVFGRSVEVGPRDRRSTTAWDLGGVFTYPPAQGREALPFAALYLWRRPDPNEFLRATIVILDNDITYAHSLAPSSPVELVARFESSTPPTPSSERVDGRRIGYEKLLWGTVGGSLGLGYRRQISGGFAMPRFLDEVDPQTPDNMFSLSLTADPQWLYTQTQHGTSNRFVAPPNTLQLDAHLALRWDAMQRNLLDLAHEGYALGFDARSGWREDWSDWGIDGRERAGRGRTPRRFDGYAIAVGGFPGLDERHRWRGSVHGGFGRDVDRFSARRVGGGPDADEFLSLSRPIVPGASLGEFDPEHYAVAIAQYRYELFFFTYLGPRVSIAWLDRDRLDGTGILRDRRSNDVLTSAGASLTTGFLFHTRLQVDYDHGFDVIRWDDGRHHRGASEVVLHLSGSF